MEDLKQLIKDTYQNLPEDLQQAVMNPSLKERLEDIGRKNNLNEAQVQALKNETYFVLLALETISDFQTNLDKQINLGEETAGKIALSVYDGIFKPIEITLLAIEQIIKEKESEDGIVPEETSKKEEVAVVPGVPQNGPRPVGSNNLPRRPEFQSLKSMMEPKEIIKPQKINREIKPAFNNQDAAIQETLRRAKAALEGNANDAESKETEEGENPNDLGDLGSDDFKWPGDISGVEIDNKPEGDEVERNDNNGNGEDNLNKATILEEIEHPPAYMSSPFEEKMKDKSPDIKPSNSPIPKNRPGGEGYGKSDPYRESVN